MKIGGEGVLKMSMSTIKVSSQFNYSRGAYSRLGPHRQCIGYWNFKHDRTNSAMTRVLILSGKMKRNKWLWY